MNDQFTTTARIVEEVVSRSQQAMETLVKTSQAQVEMASQNAKTNLQEMTALSQKNLNAFVDSTRIVARGIEQASQAIMAFAQKNNEASADALSKLTKASNVIEAAQIHQAFAKDSVTSLVSEAQRMSALTTATAREALVPLNERVSATVEMMRRPLAA